jgi:hypothetical protein
MRGSERFVSTSGFVEKDLAVPHSMVVGRTSCLTEDFFGDTPNTRMAYFSMGPRIDDKMDIVSGLLLKFNIPPPLSPCVDAFHSYHAMHGFALVLSVPRISYLCLIFEEGIIIVHLRV